MNAKELIGKWCLRITPFSRIGSSDLDTSYMSEPVKLIKLTEHHLYYHGDFHRDSAFSLYEMPGITEGWTEWAGESLPSCAQMGEKGAP